MNAPLDPTQGVVLAPEASAVVQAPGRSPELLLVLAFSGGGTRAAALAYGVLEELARVEVPTPAGRRRLLDEVDLVTAVSGGSFPAAYFGLFGDRIFDEFPQRFLERRVSARIGLRLLNPVNWWRLGSPRFGRSDLAAEVYDQILFEKGTFADIWRRGGPEVVINATDLVGEGGFSFSRDEFGWICSDLASYPVARSVAASAAVPFVLSPIALRNYGESCGLPEPDWVAESFAHDEPGSRRWLDAQRVRAYRDAARHPYLHLLDGGIADNLGLRSLLRGVIASGGWARAFEQLGLASTRRVAVIVVNAQTRPAASWGMLHGAPGVGSILEAVTSIQINRYNFETLELLRETLDAWSLEASLSRGGNAPAIDSYVVEVNFDQLTHEEERQVFSIIPTTLYLPRTTVRGLREVGGRILRDSPSFQRLLRDLEADALQQTPRGADKPRRGARGGRR